MEPLPLQPPSPSATEPWDIMAEAVAVASEAGDALGPEHLEPEDQADGQEGLVVPDPVQQPQPQHEALLCTICQQDMVVNGPLPLLALECGHVYHEVCIKRSWTLCRKDHGWCPLKCLGDDGFLSVSLDQADPEAAAPFPLNSDPSEMEVEQLEGSGFNL